MTYTDCMPKIAFSAKSKLAERRGRKATGLTELSQDSGVATKAAMQSRLHSKPQVEHRFRLLTFQAALIVIPRVCA